MNKCLFSTFLVVLCYLSSQAQHLRVTKNKRFLETNEAKPFIWIGDTAWELFHKLNREEATEYLEKRAEQGFTVIQAVVLAEDHGLEKPNPYGDLPFMNLNAETPNESYFKHVDFIVNKAEELNLVIAMLPTWADKVPTARPGNGPVIFNQHNASVFGEFLGNRYKDKSIIWVLGGDRNIDHPDAFNIWKSMAMGLKKGDKGQNLITYHPAGEASSSKWFHNESWIDFNMYQSGHAHRFMEVYKFAAEDYNRKPTKPFIDAEPAYEDIPVKFWEYIDWKSSERVPPSILDKDNLLVDIGHFKQGFFTDYDVRVHAYWNFLSGACGYTYGNNAIWQMFKKGDPFIIPCLTDWKDAMDRPGAQDMKHLRSLFEQWSFARLVPDQTLIVGENPEGPTHIRAASASDNTFALIYLTIARPVKINIEKFKGKVNFSWYDPRTGKKATVQKEKDGKHYLITPPPGSQDWVLILDTKNG